MRYGLLLIISQIVSALALVAGEPTSYRIAFAPPFTQPNAYACGPASGKMILDHFGPAVPFEDIANVVRLTSNGTAIGDLIRAGQFSRLSAAQGRTGPVAPLAGFSGRPLGLAVLAHAQATSWLAQVKALIRQDIPVLMLMQFSPQSAGGHYRVAVGYDDAARIMWFADPWGRELKGEQEAGGFQPFSYQDVEICWTYTGYGTSVPHWGAIYTPWTVAVGVASRKGALTITAVTTYPCPAPFSPAQFPASQAAATIILPAGWTTVGPALTALGTLPAGGQATSTWTVQPGAYPALIEVRSEGLVSGSLPATGPYDGTAGSGQVIPGYSYTDVIGGSGTLMLGAGG